MMWQFIKMMMENDLHVVIVKQNVEYFELLNGGINSMMAGNLCFDWIEF